MMGRMLFGAPRAAGDGGLMSWGGVGRGPLTRREFLAPAAPEPGAIIGAPAFTEFLGPRADIGGRYILMRDLRGVGLLFELIPAGIEGRPADYIETIFAKAKEAFTNAVPDAPGTRWHLQMTLEDERDLQPMISKILDYIPTDVRSSEFTQDWIARLDEHFRQAGQPQGLFEDREVTGGIWRGRMRRVRVCLWHAGAVGENDDGIDEVRDKLVGAFAQAGVRLVPARPGELYAWLTRWFVPEPGDEFAGTTEEFLRAHPWKTGAVGIGLLDDDPGDIARAACHGAPPASDREGVWYFRGRPARFLSLDEPLAEPLIGHLTAEQTVGRQKRALWDQMPAGAALSLVITPSAQDEISDAIAKTLSNAPGDKADAIAKRALGREAQEQMAAGEKLYRLFAGVYLRADDPIELKQKTAEASALLNAHGIRVIPAKWDPLAQDSFLRALPFSFDWEHDQRPYIRRSRLWWADHIGRLAPVLGRSTGTGTPGLSFWNRGAEPLTFDPLSPSDRKRNAHSLVLGPTGSGKTALLIYLLSQVLAVHRPRLFLISALPTFGLFARHAQRLGLSVNHIRIGEGDVVLPPFADAGDLAGAGERPGRGTGEGASRDLLADLERVARLMITGGEEREEREMRRHDLNLIRKAIVRAAQARAGKTTRVRDVVAALRGLAAEGQADGIAVSDAVRQSLEEKAGAMELFCQGETGAIFDGEGGLWEDADVTIFELGMFARRGYEAQLAVAVTSLLSRINDIVERDQHGRRQSITVVDEAHILLKNPLIVPYLNSIMAMWRTFGAWLWIATQTLSQFPDSARELLNQPEWWFAMTMDRGEVDQIARFKQLSDEQRGLLLAAQKEPGKYTEGVVLSDKLTTLFRSVVPAMTLALAQTEKHEKARRGELMKEHRCSEIEAADLIAAAIFKQRGGNDEQNIQSN